MTATVWGDGTPNEAFEIPPDAIIIEQSGNYLITTADANHVIDYTGAGGDIFTLPATLDAGDGFVIWIRNSGTGALTVLPQGVDTINAAASLSMAAGTSVQLMVKGVDFGIFASNGLKTQLANTIIFTPAGRIAATDVQAAIEELDAKKAELWEIDTLLTDTSPSANVITATAGRTLTAQAATGTLWRLHRSSFANTGPCTLNIDGQGAVVVTDIAGNPLVSGNILLDRVCLFYKLAASFVLINPALDIERTVTGHATTADIFAGNSEAVLFDDAAGAITVTAIPDAPRAGMTRAIRYNGATKYTADANLLIKGIASGNTVTLGAGARAVFRSITTTQFEMVYSYSGSFTITGTGFSGTPPTTTAYFKVENGIAHLSLNIASGYLFGTSNLNTFTLTGLPNCLNAGSDKMLNGLIRGMDNSVVVYTISAVFQSSVPNVIRLDLNGSATGWTAANTKHLAHSEFTYSLN